ARRVPRGLRVPRVRPALTVPTARMALRAIPALTVPLALRAIPALTVPLALTASPLRRSGTRSSLASRLLRLGPRPDATRITQEGSRPVWSRPLRAREHFY